ncbi:hypothetical protein NDN08_001424 [Rhodosorus marinus]|uniref:BZIP domain-containing protein n=1 Tax=Rhodosorus marinus TaxID=101924 RepID=A0AAV8UQR5_9RHOD|nr:hypothetical protein NDN08_001424 [Rhodosorus marinus]
MAEKVRSRLFDTVVFGDETLALHNSFTFYEQVCGVDSEVHGEYYSDEPGWAVQVEEWATPTLEQVPDSGNPLILHLAPKDMVLEEDFSSESETGYREGSCAIQAQKTEGPSGSSLSREPSVLMSLEEKRQWEALKFPKEKLGDLSGTTSSEAKRMSKEEREMVLHKRKLRNRLSAQRSRERRRAQAASRPMASSTILPGLPTSYSFKY